MESEEFLFLKYFDVKDGKTLNLIISNSPIDQLEAGKNLKT